MTEIVRIDICGDRAELLADRIAPIMSGETVGDALAALCLAVCFAIDHVQRPDDKQAVYELFIREMAKVMAVAPGVKLL